MKFIRTFLGQVLGTPVTAPQIRDTPNADDFYVEATDEHRRLYRGATADIFFSNTGRVTHKWLHYFSIYDQLLGQYAGTDVKMLEIGVFKGGSLGLWRKFLGSKATIFGIDINPDCAAFDGEFAQVRIGSQDDPDFLRKVVAEMGGIDVVLDDGSHLPAHQRASFEILFPLLTEGGLYLIEDLCTAYWPSYEGGLKRPGTAIEFLKDKIDELQKQYYAGETNVPGAMTDIESVQFFDGIAAVRKRKQLPRYHTKVPPEAPA